MRQQALCLLLTLLLALPAPAAFHAATEWEVRTTGSNNNGGGFQVGSTGTDYSQQDAAQIAYTDILVGGVTTQYTSALNPVAADTVGNVVNITGGAGCTVQRVQIVSQAAGVATVDKSLGAAGSTCTGNLGGGLLTIATATGLAVAGNIIHIQAGTYTLTAAVGFTAATAYILRGYQTVHNDGGTKPLITTATDSTMLFDLVGNTSRHTFDNLSLSSTAAVRAPGISQSSDATPSVWVYHSILDGFTTAIGGQTGSTRNFPVVQLFDVEIKNCTDGVHGRTPAMFSSVGVWIHDCTGNGFRSSLGGTLWMDYTIISDVGADGTVGIANVSVTNSAIYSAGSDAIDLPTSVNARIANSILYGSTGWGVNSASSGNQIVVLNTAMGANGSGDTTGVPFLVDNIVLSADPFTNAGAGDYSLNNTAGGGAACRAAGFPGAYLGGTTTSFLDVGAAQRAAGGGAGGPSASPIVF